MMGATEFILLALVVGGLAWAFYTGHLHGVATMAKSVAATLRDASATHASLADELRTARDNLRALILPAKARHDTATAVQGASAAVAAAEPKDIAMLRPAAVVVPVVDPIKVAQVGLIDAQIKRLQDDRAALAK
jgi:hypothetical protein